MKLSYKVALSIAAVLAAFFLLSRLVGLTSGQEPILFVGLFAFLTGTVYLVAVRPLRRVAERLAKLGSSPLNPPKIGNELTTISDAVTQLERQLNELATQLHGVRGELTVQKSVLEREVEERTKQLKIARDRVSQGYFQIELEKSKLIAAVNGLPWGLLITNLELDNVLINQMLETILGKPPNSKWTLQELAAFFKHHFDLMAAAKQVLTKHTPFERKSVEYKDKFLRVIVELVMSYQDPVHPSVPIGLAVVVEDVTSARLLEHTRDEFFGIASHELRTPLTAIRGNSALIREYFSDKLMNKDLREMISDMYDSSVRLIKIVNDFLNVSRLEEKRIELKSKPFDILSLAKECSQQLLNLATTKGLSLTVVDPARTIAEAVGDRDRAKEVFINLLDNAIKYTQKGGVTVTLEEADGFVKVRVTDNGLGIPPENRAKLFKKFQQIGGLSRDVTRSTGMGLYIAKLLVGAMGGTIFLERSEEGKGSTFAFTLPARNPLKAAGSSTIMK